MIKIQEIFFIYIDILGYLEIPLEMDKESIRDADYIREGFKTHILKKLNILKKIYSEINYKTGLGDDFLIYFKPRIFYNPVNICFDIIAELISLDLGYKGKFKDLPLEIGVGIQVFNKDINLNELDISSRTPTIQLMKDKSIVYYKNWYEKQFGKSVENTFIIQTANFYNKLNFFERNLCKAIEFKGSTIYKISVENVLKIKKSLDFIKKIRSNPYLYKNIDCVYVPPDEFDDILKILEKNKCVFITGTSGYGKTFTAVYLLWKYYNLGYDTVWVPGDEPKKREEVRESLERLEFTIKPRHVIYFEDPFGKFEYEKRENLERDILSLIELIKSTENFYVIITSREEIFKEFKKESLYGEKLVNLEVKINIKNLSYNFEKRLKILLNWAKIYNPVWLNDDNLINEIKILLERSHILPTPLNIKEFVKASEKINDKKKLHEIAIVKSNKSHIEFSKEILSMRDDKIIFLLLIFLFIKPTIKNLEIFFNEIKLSLDIKSYDEYYEIIEWFKEDKLKIDRPYFTFQTDYELDLILTLSHPSYHEAVEISISLDKEVMNYYSKILLYFSEEYTENDILVKILLSLDNYFDLIISEIRNQIFLNLSTIESLAEWLAKVYEEQFNKIPYDVSNEIFSNLLDFNLKYALEDIMLDHYNLISNKNKKALYEKFMKGD